jgi:outer membrane protein
MRWMVAAVALACAPGCGSVERWATHDAYLGAPASSAVPWRPPATVSAPPVAAAREIDAQKTYGTAELIDVALRHNPDTRQAWESARAAAARTGIAESAYLPVLVAQAMGGYSQVVYQTKSGFDVVRGAEIEPEIELTWVLLDFGRRSARYDRAAAQLAEQNFAFNRQLQDVAFAVQRAAFAFDARRAEVLAGEATVKTARAVEAEAEARLARGLATQPEVLLARQERVRSEYQLAAARGGVDDARAALAESLGISPAVPLQVAEFAEAPPAELLDSVEHVMDQALADRPDLAARLAALRAREAEVRRARAAYLPTLSFNGNGGGFFSTWRSGPPFHSFDAEQPEYGAFLELKWTLFDGAARDFAVREAEAQRGAAGAEAAALQLRVLREVWQAYADVKTAEARRDFAEALLAAAHESYAAVLESYRQGLSTFVELRAAERDLAQARSARIESRAELLTAAAALAHAAGRRP